MTKAKSKSPAAPKAAPLATEQPKTGWVVVKGVVFRGENLKPGDFIPQVENCERAALSESIQEVVNGDPV